MKWNTKTSRKNGKKLDLETRVDELAQSGRGKNFEPGPGHVMKEWVVIPDKTADWLELAREAYQFVKRTRTT